MAAADFQAISLVTFLWGLAKKVTRLPAGTGEVAFKSLCFNRKTGGTRPARYKGSGFLVPACTAQGTK
jgi:hypothetical protein